MNFGNTSYESSEQLMLNFQFYFFFEFNSKFNYYIHNLMNFLLFKKHYFDANCNTVVDIKFEPQQIKPVKQFILSAGYYKNLNEIILNSTYKNKINTNYYIFLCNWLFRKKKLILLNGFRVNDLYLIIPQYPLSFPLHDPLKKIFIKNRCHFSLTKIR